jgi:hypothetical protein
MPAVFYLMTWLGVRLSSFGLLGERAPLTSLLSSAVSTPTPGSGTDPNATNISNFFGRLSNDLLIFALTMAGFFFALSALFYMSSGATGNERTRQHAISALYAALAGLALALLAGSIAALVNNAALGK